MTPIDFLHCVVWAHMTAPSPGTRWAMTQPLESLLMFIDGALPLVPGHLRVQARLEPDTAHWSPLQREAAIVRSMVDEHAQALTLV
jgi:hypothetical protein